MFSKSKKDIKLFPMPDMGPTCCSSLLDGLFPKVYAQTMNPTGMIYTQVNIGTNGVAYATGVTDASSSCYCHQSTVTVTLRSPTGRQASNSRYNAVETARADTWLSHLEGEDGFTTATSTHKAYCPYCHCYFINSRQTSQGFTAIEHAYPQPPLSIPCKIKRFFDSITSAGTKHRAQDISGDGIAVGTPVYAAEGGWIDGIQTGQAHDPRSEQIVNGIPACSGQGSPANYVRIRDQQAPGGNKTTYVHVTVCCGLSVGMRVEASQQIGTVDVSGCSTGPHVHMQRRKPAGNLVNFSVPCNYNNLVPSGFNYEDGPFSY
jgi:murein DD-endopeptidase MepM/ murein hydrolase activator NlpD